MADRYRNWLRTLGAPEDPVATDTSSDWSAMSLLKAMYAGIDGLRVSPSTDNAIPRFDGIAGALQDSGITISDTNVMVGASQMGIGVNATPSSAASDLFIATANGAATQMELLQVGVALGLIGNKASDPNFYITNDFDSTGLGLAARSITLDRFGKTGLGTGATALTAKLQIAADGAYPGAAVGPQLSITGVSNANKVLNLGIDTTSNYAYLQGILIGTTYLDTYLNPGGGNVGIGTAPTAGNRLHVLGHALFQPTISDALGLSGFVIQPVMTATSSSIASGLHVTVSDRTQLSANQYFHAIASDIHNNLPFGTQAAAVLGFMYSYLGSDPFGADFRAIVPATATVNPANVVGCQGTIQWDKTAPVAGNIWGVNSSNYSTGGQKGTVAYAITGSSGWNFLMTTSAGTFTDEGIVLSPADDLNPSYRVFGVTNAAGSVNNFFIRKDGGAFFRSSIDITSAGATALAVGRLGTTTPAFLVDASTATSITGIKVKSAASGGGVAISAIGETNVALSLDAAGNGAITVGGISAGGIILTRATTISAALTYGGVTLSNSVTGTGSMVLSTSAVLTTPALGTPSSGVLSSCSGYAQSALTGLGAGVSTFLGTPSSANLAAAITDETGSGALMFGTSPTILTTLTVNTGADNVFKLGQHASFGVYNALSMNNNLTDAGLTGFFAGANADTNFYFQVGAGNIQFRVGGTPYLIMSSTGLAVTGTSTATATIQGRSATATPAAASAVKAFSMGSAAVGVYWGTGDPNTALTAPRGSIYLRTDGGAGTSLYTNTDGATAWSAV